MKPPALALEIGGTKLQLALGFGDGSLLAKHSARIDATQGADALRRQIAEIAKPFLASNGIPVPHAVGVGFGGPLDWRSGTIVTSHQVAGWTNFPLASWLREVLGTPAVAVANDSDAAALGEARFGAGVGFSPMLYVNSGSGVGGGLVVDGALYRGGPIGSLEIGHLWLCTPPGHAASNPVKLENVASGWAIARALADRLKSENAETVGPTPDPALPQSAEYVARRAASGDPIALEVLDHATSAMAQALGHAVTLLAPQRVVLGGGVSEMPEDLWIRPIRQKLIAHAFQPFAQRCDVVKAALGQDVVLHGALALAFDQPLSPNHAQTN